MEGFIVSGREPAAIAEAMVKLAQDRELNSRMGDAAYEKGAEGNTWQDYGDRLLAEYGRRLEKRAVNRVTTHTYPGELIYVKTGGVSTDT